MERLADRVCVVTGGARGIGAAMADELAGHGARLAITDPEWAAAEARPPSFSAAAASPTRSGATWQTAESELAAAAATKHDRGLADVLVNNAGLALIGPSLNFPEGRVAPLARRHDDGCLEGRSSRVSSTRTPAYAGRR